MICIILVAGHGAKLESDIKNDTSGNYASLVGVPKALLPGACGGKKILDYWWDVVNARQIFSVVYLVTNADKYKHFERWATASGFPVENIINDGTTTLETSLGSVADFELVLCNRNINENVVVVAGDMLFENENFDMQQVVRYFQHKEGDLAIYYEMNSKEDRSTRGIIEVEKDTNKILKFFEKPVPGVTDSLLATVVFYCFRKSTLKTVSTYLEQNTQTCDRTFGKYMSWLVNDQKLDVYGMKLPTRFQLIGQVSLFDYQERINYFMNRKKNLSKTAINCRVYARIGLMGNPSDNFYGKTISLTISNFWADVMIQESEQLILCPHPLNDPTTFGSLQDLHGISRKEGYLGGLRLLQATCKKFYQYCCENGIALYKRNFTLSYDTNIPRQVGLAGSSAIVTATLKALMEFYNLTDTDLPKPFRASLILDVETAELHISAGLQDRVVQVYEGLVYMDFAKDFVEEHGHGKYEQLSVTKIPKLFLAYLTESSDSGKVHSNIKQRYDSGEEAVIKGMKDFARFTDEARTALLRQDRKKLAELMNANFDLRRQLYGDECIGQSMLSMLNLAREFGASAKFPGSGGAIVGIYPDDETNIVSMKKAMLSRGYVLCDVIPYTP